MFSDVEINRDFLEEKSILKQYDSKHTCYKMYLKNEKTVIGQTDYRLFNNQQPYWYIDEFLIFEEFRGKGYGTILLNHIVDKMWCEQRLPINIDPSFEQTLLSNIDLSNDLEIQISKENSKLQISKENFIKWLVKRGFIETNDFFSMKKIICQRLP